MVELSFYISPEDQARFTALLDRLAISDREFLYRAFTRYMRFQEQELAKKEASGQSQHSA